MGEVNRFNTREVCAYTPNYTAAFAVQSKHITAKIFELAVPRKSKTGKCKDILIIL